MTFLGNKSNMSISKEINNLYEIILLPEIVVEKLLREKSMHTGCIIS